MQQSKHTAVRVGPFDVCMACHLLWPCMDGKILTYSPRKDPDHWFSVREIREYLTT